MSERFITIKEVVLNNNCPECYSKGGLRLTFKQQFIETKFYKSITNNIKNSIACKTCNTTIYPVQWTDDIERVFEYQQKAFVPKKASTYLKKATWIVIVFVVVAIIAVLFFILYPKL